ncbi:MAG: hypothetical protein IPN94_03105 [Sphingobacteriales bacterium]|nr:hypothetical protein [Sphingobacteriales bacterium]
MEKIGTTSTLADKLNSRGFLPTQSLLASNWRTSRRSSACAVCLPIYLPAT